MRAWGNSAVTISICPWVTLSLCSWSHPSPSVTHPSQSPLPLSHPSPSVTPPPQSPLPLSHPSPSVTPPPQSPPSALKGLSTAMVEKFDFSSGTSSRSTKLIHGGVRYLQKAILGLDREQYNMVKEALSERATLIRNAPHLAYPLPIMLPIYK